jgi:ketosteroid isomerase-like protein
MRYLSLLAFLVLPQAAVADWEDEVRCHEIGFSRAVESGDFERFKSFIDADARFVGGSVRRGVEDVASAWSVFFAPGGPSIKWRPQFVEVLEDGSLALSRGPFRMTSVDADGNATEVWGTFNSTWRPQPEGGWKVVFDAGSSEPESPSAEIRALLDEPDECEDTASR